MQAAGSSEAGAATSQPQTARIELASAPRTCAEPVLLLHPHRVLQQVHAAGGHTDRVEGGLAQVHAHLRAQGDACSCHWLAPEHFRPHLLWLFTRLLHAQGCCTLLLLLLLESTPAPALVVHPEAEAERVLGAFGVGGVKRRALLLFQERQVRLRLALQQRRSTVGLLHLCCA